MNEVLGVILGLNLCTLNSMFFVGGREKRTIIGKLKE
jgi:hypothetical protein